MERLASLVIQTIRQHRYPAGLIETAPPHFAQADQI